MTKFREGQTGIPSGESIGSIGVGGESIGLAEDTTTLASIARNAIVLEDGDRLSAEDGFTLVTEAGRTLGLE